jgi:hypothetical protein
MTPRSAFALAILLASGSPLPAQTGAAPPPAPSPRAELDDLRTSLETAIGRPGRIRLAAGPRTAGRVYRLKGYGAVIVLAPRALPVRPFVVRRGGPEAPGGFPANPSGPRVVITVPEGTFDVGLIDLGDLEREMEVQMAAQAAALREMETAQSEWTRASEEEIREHLRLVEQQAEAFRLEAERARRKAEREVRTRLAPPAPAAVVAPEPVVAPVAPVLPAPAPVPPLPPPAPAAPVPDDPFFTADAPLPPEPPDAPPPWRFWFDVTDGPAMFEATDAADAEAVVTSVRERVVAGLEAYRRPLASLRVEDFVTVAVDLVPDVLLRARPARTILVRVRAGDLQDRRTGRISAAEFRKRVEFEEN